MAQTSKVTVPYRGDELAFGVPARQLMGVYAPHDVAPEGDERAAVARALAQPVAAPTLEELARGARDVVIVADDNTRLTPTATIVPALLDALNRGGVPDAAVTVLIALGTHRPMTPTEILDKFGAEVVARVPVWNHEAFDRAALADLGTTPGGVSVSVHRRVVGADLVVGVGSIVPHHIPGYSGGAKIIQPGVCGERTTGEVHLLSVRHASSLLGTLENQVRAEMEAIAERAGLRAILNTVLDRHGRLVGAVYGEPRAAFRRGVAISRQVYGVPMPGLAEIVVSNSHPCDLDFWQAHKTLYPAERCVRPGGTIIVTAPCPEGVSAMHPSVLGFASWPKARIDAALRAGEIEDLTAGALALAWATVKERATVALVSDGISPEEARALGFHPFAAPSEALAAALRRHGAEARVAVLPFAPDTLPLPA